MGPGQVFGVPVWHPQRAGMLSAVNCLSAGMLRIIKKPILGR